MGFGWKKFAANPAPTLIPVLVGSAIQFFATLLLYGLLIALILAAASSSDPYGIDSSPNFAVWFIIYLILFVGLTLVLELVYASWVKAGLEVARGRAPSLADTFQGWSKGAMLLLGLGVGLITYVPALVFDKIPTVGGLLYIAWFATVTVTVQFAPLIMIADHQGPADATRASFALVTAHLGPVLILDLLIGIAVFAGVLLCGIGTLVAVPVVVIAHAYAFLRLRGEPVAA